MSMLRTLAALCNFAATLDTEILRHFVVSCGMIQVELVMANERSASNLKDLRGPFDHSTINCTNARANELKDWRKPAGSSNGRSSGGGSRYRNSGEGGRQSSSGSSGVGRCDRCGRYAHKSDVKKVFIYLTTTMLYFIYDQNN